VPRISDLADGDRRTPQGVCSTSVWVRLPDGRDPTAVHVVGPLHVTASSVPGDGVVSVDQVVPVRRSTSEWDECGPTATHVVALGQATPVSAAGDGVGGATTDQAAPFQCSTTG
jgi:hypothetical protein